MIHRRAVFFDRDGTILIPPDEYISKPNQVVFYPGVPEGLSLLKRRGMRRVVVTNQAAVGRGLVSEMDLLQIHNHMKRILVEWDADIDAILYSPYYPAADRPEHRRRAEKRKPGPGLFDQAARQFRISLADSFVVGDRPEDLEAARRIGARSVLVLTGKGEETRAALHGAGSPAQIVPDAGAAAVWICRQVCETPLAGKSVLFVLAGRDFQEREYLVTRYELEALGADIQVAGPAASECVGSAGLRVRPDLTHKEALADPRPGAVVFIGGDGARNLQSCKICQDLARRTYEAKRTLAAICVAPSILARAYLLTRKESTAWHTELAVLRKHGAQISTHPVARDGQIVTAAGPQHAETFAEEIRAAILGEKKIGMTVAGRAETSY